MTLQFNRTRSHVLRFIKTRGKRNSSALKLAHLPLALLRVIDREDSSNCVADPLLVVVIVGLAAEAEVEWLQYSLCEHFSKPIRILNRHLSDLLRGITQDLLGLLLKAVDPLVVRGVCHAHAEDQPPVEVLHLDIALLTTEGAVALIKNL